MNLSEEIIKVSTMIKKEKYFARFPFNSKGKMGKSPRRDITFLLI